MKASALFFLLQSRARHFDRREMSASNAAFAEIGRSLEVRYGNSAYQLTWKSAGRSRHLTLPDSAFRVYVVGDRPGLAAVSSPGSSIRVENWKAAYDVWTQMAKASGLAPPVDAAHAVGRDAGSDVWLEVTVVAAIAMVAAAVLTGVGRAPEAGLVAACSYALAWFMCSTDRGWRLGRIEGGIAGLASLFVLLPGAASGRYTVVVVGIVIVCAIERVGSSRLLWWVIGAGTCGLTAGLGGTGALAGTALLVLAEALLVAVTPSKAPRNTATGIVLAWAVAAGVGSAAATWTGYSTFASIPGAGYAGVVVGGVVAILLVGTSLIWWIQGVLHYPAPWLAMPAIATMIAVAGCTGDFGMVRAGAATAGVAAVVTARLVIRWRRSIAF